jgi:2-polyprenyl-6-methoxyphenol hydroxylase-like FAD-dependent oxidoreductase
MSAETPLKETPTSATTATVEAVPHSQVLIVGAGPVGLFLGLKLAQQGIKTTILDAEPEIVKSPRAITYSPINQH